MLCSMSGLGKKALVERADTAMPTSHVRDARHEPMTDSSGIQSAESWEEPLQSDLPFVSDDGGDGATTRAMEAMSLVEAEREIARQARESGRSGEHAISTVAPPEEVAPIAFGDAGSNPVPRQEVGPSVAAPAAPAPAVEVAPPPREQRRRAIATVIVAVVMLAALALAGVGLSRKGLQLPAQTSSGLRP
jgi:hypothetical protein